MSDDVSADDSERSNTKYGEMIADYDWSKPEPADDQNSIPVTVTDHKIDLVFTTDPDETHGYGREKYTVTIKYEDGLDPEVLYAIKHRWKGNYWRDTHDLDWLDVPEPVRVTVASLLPVGGPDDLNNGVRLFDEGGESRWEKYHKPRMEAMSSDEMWGSSFLRDAMKEMENAAESLEDEAAKQSAENIIDTIQELIKSVESDENDTPSTTDNDHNGGHN